MKRPIWTFRDNQKGAVLVLVAILTILFLGIAALAIDVYHVYVVRNELQNAADAGALYGARVLYTADGEAVNPGANTEAYDTAIANLSENIPVELIYNAASNSGDVQRGFWSFSTRKFYPNDSLAAIDIGSYTKEELDDPDRNKQGGDISFINAVKVKVRRQDKPAASYFAQIFGFENFGITAEAVAYRGFAGSINPGEIDQPIAICEESIINEDGDYDCNMGRMLNSGANLNTSNTGGWTNFSQPCATANASEMRNLICGDGNPDEMKFGSGIGAVGGVQDVVFRDLADCWEAATNKTSIWNMTLPVIQCPSNNVSNCSNLVGAVNVNIVWILRDNDTSYADVPREMEDWSCPASTPGFDCWKSFVDHFNLANVTGPPQSDEDYEEMYQKKNIFFLPSCEKITPTGVTGGPNFGVLAKIPVLVD